MIPERIIQKARDVDLLTYLQLTEPGQLVRVSKDTYCTREHDSLKINNGMWFWFSREIGGASALDYLIKVEGCSLPEAVSKILDEDFYERIPKDLPRSTYKPELRLPLRFKNNDRIIFYLISRGIDYVIIRYCINMGILYESKKYHSVVFIGQDDNGIPRYAAVRGTKGGFVGEMSGSEKEYSFRLGSFSDAKELHVFEAAIDLLSYLTLLKMRGQDWMRDAYLSLGGICGTKDGTGIYKQIDRALKVGSRIRKVVLHLDNDEPGRAAAQNIAAMLEGSYEVIDDPPPVGKDVNNYLQSIVYKRKTDERKGI